MIHLKPLSAAWALGVASIALIAADAPGKAPIFNATADVAAIKALEKELATELDVEKVMDLYAEDAVVLDLFSPGVFKGKAAIRAGFTPQLGEIRSLRETVPEFSVATNGHFGCAASQIAYETEMKDGQKFKMNVRVLDALKKIDGKWKVVQQHLSLPIDRATLAALPDAPITPRTLTWTKTPLAPASVSREEGNKEIRAFLDEGGESIGLEMLMRYYGPGDDILLYDAFHPQALIGRKEISDYYAPLMDSYTGVDLTMPIFEADSDGSFGIQIDTQNLTLTMKDGSKQQFALRQSDCMRRVDGHWYSFFEMISYPVDKATMKADMRWTQSVK